MGDYRINFKSPSAVAALISIIPSNSWKLRLQNFPQKVVDKIAELIMSLDFSRSRFSKDFYRFAKSKSFCTSCQVNELYGYTDKEGELIYKIVQFRSLDTFT